LLKPFGFVNAKTLAVTCANIKIEFLVEVTMLDNLLLQRSQNVKTSFYSRSLDKEMSTLIYLPKGYNPINKYPVLYLLHGFSGNMNTILINHGLDNLLDNLISKSVVESMIIVAPNYEGSYGIDSADVCRVWHQNENGTNRRYEGKYESFIVKDLIEYVDSNFSTNTRPSSRFIGGWSMGGYAALHIAFRNSHLFSKVCGMGTGIQKPETNILVYNWMYPNEEARKNRDPLALAKYKDLSKLHIYLNCGKEDPFLNANIELVGILKERDIRVEFVCNSGGHTAKYIQENLESFILFLRE